MEEEPDRLLQEVQRRFTRDVMLLLCGVSITALTFILILLPQVLAMGGIPWMIAAASAADIAGCIVMLRWRRAYRLIMPSHYPTELGRGRLHKGAVIVQIAAVAVLVIAYMII